MLTLDIEKGPASTAPEELLFNLCAFTSSAIASLH